MIEGHGWIGDTIYGQPILEPSTNAYAILKDFYGIQVAPQAVPGLEIMECTIPSPAPGEDQVRRNSRVDHLIPSSPVSLLFLTSTAKLRIGFGSITYIPQEGTSESVCLGPFYTICSPNDTSHVIGSINLNRSWRETQPEDLVLDFIVIRATPNAQNEPFAGSSDRRSDENLAAEKWQLKLLCNGKVRRRAGLQMSQSDSGLLRKPATDPLELIII